jgi:K+ transporter
MSTMAIPGDLRTHTPRGSLGTLALGALGVVYGDIGTSLTES